MSAILELGDALSRFAKATPAGAVLEREMKEMLSTFSAMDRQHMELLAKSKAILGVAALVEQAVPGLTPFPQGTLLLINRLVEIVEQAKTDDKICVSLGRQIDPPEHIPTVKSSPNAPRRMGI